MNTPRPWKAIKPTKNGIIAMVRPYNCCFAEILPLDFDVPDYETARLIENAPLLLDVAKTILENLDNGNFAITNTETNEPGNLDALRAIVKRIEL